MFGGSNNYSINHFSSDEVATIIADLCICQLCKNIFKHPIILPCFHTFCSECLDKHNLKQTPQEGPKPLSCPECYSQAASADKTAKSSPEQFSQDTFIANLLTVLEAFKGDKSCDICQRREDHDVASSWCVDCCDALCSNCCKVHLYGKTTSSHKILSMTELQRQSVQSVVNGTSSQRCHIHREEVIKLFCLDCGQPVCVQCLASTHKKCEKCVPIAEARKLAEGDITEVVARLQAEVTESSKEQTQARQVLESIEGSISQTETQIRSVAEDLRRRITEYEEALLEKLHSVGSRLIQKGIDAHNLTESGNDSAMTLTSASKRMNALLKYGSDLDILDIYHRVKVTLPSLRSNASDKDRVMLRVSFDVDDAVKIFTRDFEKLGDIRVEDSGHDDGLSSWGVAVTPRNEIVVTHSKHKRVQKFTSSGSLVDHVQLNEEPRDITSFGRRDVAITITKKQIIIMSVPDKLELKRRIQTQRQYDGIAFCPTLPCFLVSSLDENCIDLITTEGDITLTFNVNETTLEPVFGCPRYVTFTKEGHFVISDTDHNSVSCISQDGVLHFMYAPTDKTHGLKRAQGVCCDKNGNVFVADYGNSRIHLLGFDGNFQRFIVGRDSELRRPVALTMTDAEKLVVVQSDGIVKIFSYEGNTAQGEGQEIPIGQPGQGRHRLYSSPSLSLHQALKGSRRTSMSSDSQSAVSTLSPHTFRSRHF